jgi:hypothetical protein
MIETIFDQCVYLLVFLADQLGMTYKEINVWIFVFIWPVFTLVLIGLVILQRLRIRRLLSEVQALRESQSAT